MWTKEDDLLDSICLAKESLIYGDGIPLSARAVLGTDKLELEAGRRRSVDSDNLAARVNQRAAGITWLDIGVGLDQAGQLFARTG